MPSSSRKNTLQTGAHSGDQAAAAGSLAGRGNIPLWVNIAATVWLAAWFPVYAVYYGWVNFLHLSDIAVILITVGLWTSSSLLISSQAVSVLIGETVWVLDVLWTEVFGRHLVGGTEYMWNQQYPLWVRLLSLFHFVLPVLLVWGVARLGYDRRAFKLQAGIGAAALIGGRIWGRKDNINFAFRDPVFHRVWGPAPTHLLMIFAGMLVLVYLPTHCVLERLFGKQQ